VCLVSEWFLRPVMHYEWRRNYIQRKNKLLTKAGNEDYEERDRWGSREEETRKREGGGKERLNIYVRYTNRLWLKFFRELKKQFP
jgi:hypothetical protein